MSIFSSPLGVQSATVVDNKDPNQMGRVKVNFPWDENSVQSAWASVAQPMAGNAYGVYFLPEVGDTVLVGFLNNNHDTPIVIGAIYTGQGKQADCYDADNYIKNIKTKGGNEIRFTDKKGEETITITNTTNGNQIAFDMKNDGTLTLTSPHKISLVAPAIELNGGSINISGGDIKMTGTKEWSGKPLVHASVGSVGDIKMEAQNKFYACGDAGMKLEGNNAVYTGGKVSLESQMDLTIKSGAQLAVSATTSADLKANAQMTVESTGITTIKGSMVMIN